jgi:hypothetical protein
MLVPPQVPADGPSRTRPHDRVPGSMSATDWRFARDATHVGRAAESPSDRTSVPRPLRCPRTRGTRSCPRPRSAVSGRQLQQALRPFRAGPPRREQEPACMRGKRRHATRGTYSAIRVAAPATERHARTASRRRSRLAQCDTYASVIPYARARERRPSEGADHRASARICERFCYSSRSRHQESANHRS